MKYRAVADLSALKLHGQGSASLTWWGTLAFMLIEGSGFAMVIAVYLYFAVQAPQWPLGAPPPDLGPGTAITVLLLASLVPNAIVGRWAGRGDVGRVRIGLIVMSLFAIGPLALRAYEFGALHVSWDSNAYGSVTWTLLGLHATHIATDLIDTMVLAAVFFTRHASNSRRFADVQDNAMYWNFVVLTWLPIYACIYWVPRL